MAVSAVTGSVDPAPYAGRPPFSADNSQRFFGRSVEAREAAELWQRNRVTVLAGPSGIGKTSLLQAGVVPSLDQSHTEVLAMGRVSRGTAFPVAALPEHNPYTLALLGTWSPAEPETRLSGLTVHNFLRERAVHVDPYGQPLPVLAAIDQVEELFTDLLHGERHRQSFIDELAEALEEMPQLHLMLAIRDDFLDEFGPSLRALTHSDPAVLRLRPLSLEAALAGVQEPLRGTGRSFAPGVAEKLVGSLRTGGAVGAAEWPADGEVEPFLLQVVCAGLWAALPASVREITLPLLDRYGDITRLLTSFCEKAVSMVAIDHGIPAPELRTWLDQVFVTELGTRGTAYEGVARTAGMPNTVVRALRDWHILAAARRSGSRWYELHHDYLIGPIRSLGRRIPDEAEAPSRVGPADYVRAAELAMAAGDLELAERHAAEALRTADPEDLKLCAQAESLLGNVAYSRDQPRTAETRYQAAAVLFETLQDTQAVAGLLAAVGQSLLAQGEYGKAVDYLHAAVGRIPNDLTVQTEFAWALWHAGQHQAAIAVLTGVLSIDGNAADALRARGEILADLGDAEKALRDLNRIQRHQRPSTRAARGLALATLKKLSAADPEIHDALSRAPDSGPVLLYAARVAALGHDPAIAADLARRAVSATDPAVPPHQRQQALQLMEAAS